MTIDDDRDALAAEYVLGTLDSDERAQAHALIMVDAGFADAVRVWERRLGELHVLVAPVEPPAETWDKIKVRIAGVEPSGEVRLPEAIPVPAVAPAAAPPQAPPPQAPPPPAATVTVAEPTAAPAAAVVPPTPAAAPAPEPAPAVAPAPSAAPVGGTDATVVDLSRRLSRARRFSTGLTLLAATLAGVVVVREIRPDLIPEPLRPKPVIRVVEKTVEVVKTVEVPSPRPAEFVAVLQKDGAAPAFLLSFDLDRRTVTVRRVGAERQAGKSYELWIIQAKDPTPRSLGVVGSEEFVQRQASANFDQLTLSAATYAVSLEPEGGSPSGAPTGPVLFTGKLTQATPPGFRMQAP